MVARHLRIRHLRMRPLRIELRYLRMRHLRIIFFCLLVIFQFSYLLTILFNKYRKLSILKRHDRFIYISYMA